MRVQRLTNQKTICIIDKSVFIRTYRNGNKYVTIIITPMVTQVITYKTEREQYKDTFKRIRIMTASKNRTYEMPIEEMWKCYKYYVEE